MPNIKSQKKRVVISAKENEINVAKRSKVRTGIKKFQAAVEAKDLENAEKLLREAISLIDEAKYDGIYKAETASRKVSRLSSWTEPKKPSNTPDTLIAPRALYGARFLCAFEFLPTFPHAFCGEARRSDA